MPRDCAQSSTPPTSAPDCDRKASLPGLGFAMPKLALTRSAGTQIPRQFGPTIRRQHQDKVAPIGAMIVHHSVRAARIGRGVAPDSSAMIAFQHTQGLERDQVCPRRTVRMLKRRAMGVSALAAGSRGAR
jgi:hypothetical protein